MNRPTSLIRQSVMLLRDRALDARTAHALVLLDRAEAGASHTERWAAPIILGADYRPPPLLVANDRSAP